MKRILVIMSLAIVLLSGCAAVDFVKNKVSSWTADEVVLHTKKGDHVVAVEVADTLEEREKGLMGRAQLEDGHGMWFEFEGMAPRTFWMKSTLMPLDIIFLDDSKKVVRIIEAMNPCTTPVCALYNSEVPAQYALELPVGFVKAKGVALGNTVEVK